MPYRAPTALLTLLVASLSVAAEDRVDQLIRDLANPDPALRQKAFDELVSTGEPARAKLSEAAKSPRPAIATAAAAALAKLPWDRPGDSQRVANSLKLYGDADENVRISILLELISMPDATPDVPAAVVRVLQQEPSPRVAWTVALRLDPDASEPWQKAVARIEPGSSSSPVKLILASQQLATERPDAKQQLRDVLRGSRAELAGMDINVAQGVYGLAARNELHADAAWALEQVLAGAEGQPLTVNRGNAQSIWPDAEMAAKIQWHKFKDAEARKDETEMKAIATTLADSGSADMSIFLDVLATLEKSKDAAKVDAYFQRAYDAQKARIDEQPDEPVHKNDLAWLLARSGRKLADAEALAEAAVNARPDEAAYLDTLAEAKFRLGKIDEAIALEEKALKQQPNDKFMNEQLQRFKAARATTRPAN